MSLQTLKQSAGHLNVFLYTRAQEWLVKWSQSEHIPKNPVCFSDQSSVNMSEVFYNLKLPDNLIQFLGQPVREGFKKKIKKKSDNYHFRGRGVSEGHLSLFFLV